MAQQEQFDKLVRTLEELFLVVHAAMAARRRQEQAVPPGAAPAIHDPGWAVPTATPIQQATVHAPPPQAPVQSTGDVNSTSRKPWWARLLKHLWR